MPFGRASIQRRRILFLAHRANARANKLRPGVRPFTSVTRHARTLPLLMLLLLGCVDVTPDDRKDSPGPHVTYIVAGDWENTRQASRAFDRAVEERRALEALGYDIVRTVEGEARRSGGGDSLRIVLRDRLVEFRFGPGAYGTGHGEWRIVDRPTDTLGWRLTLDVRGIQAALENGSPATAVQAYVDSIRSALLPDEYVEVLRLRR